MLIAGKGWVLPMLAMLDREGRSARGCAWVRSRPRGRPCPPFRSSAMPKAWAGPRNGQFQTDQGTGEGQEGAVPRVGTDCQPWRGGKIVKGLGEGVMLLAAWLTGADCAWPLAKGQGITTLRTVTSRMGSMALSDAERAKRYRDRRSEGVKPVQYRRPAVRRSKPRQWEESVQTLLDLLDGYQDWRDAMPPGVADSATAQKLDDMLELRDLVEQLQAADPPKGFGRD